MRAYRYIKIPYGRAVELGLHKLRAETSDGCVIINESDLMTYGSPEDSFEDKVASLEGVVLSNLEARQELKK